MSKAYRESGVDLEAGYESVRLIKDHVARTKNLGSIDSLGAFGGMFDLTKYGIKNPILVSGTDGVGTKIFLAFEMDKHDTIGIDVVAMCVNDVLVQGARPLFFLDYLAVHKNIPTQIAELVSGVADGCVQAEAALIGGETAEMNDLYEEHHYDIAGFTVGVVDKDKLIDGSKVKPGDKVIGLASSGVHSNGFSLVRKVLLKDNHLDLNEYHEEFGKTLGEELLTPTRIYVKSITPLFDNNVDVHAMAHITGGGFYENLPRVLPKGCGIKIDTNSFKTPAIFDLIAKLGHIELPEMYNVFNMGIGFVVIVDENDVEKTMDILRAQGEDPKVIGEITDTEGVDLLW